MAFFRSMIQKREFSLSRWQAWLDGGMSTTSAGVDVNDQTALKWSAVWGCVLVLSQDIAKLPLPVYRRLDDDSRTEAREHPLWGILNVAPNPYMTAYQLRQALQKHLGIRGNAFAKIDRENGRIKALWPRTPDRMDIEVVKGGLVYWYTLDDGTKVKHRPDEILHLKGLSDDGIVGYSPVEVFRDGIALALSYQQHATKSFGAGVRAPFILRGPEGFGSDKAKEFSQYWQETYGGSENAGKTPLIYGGMDVTNIGFSNKDAEFIDSPRFAAENAYQLWRVPPTKAMDFLRATYSNITETNIAYVVDSLMPWETNWEQEIHHKLLTEQERQTYYVEHNNYSLLKGTPAELAEVEETYVRSGISQVNEIRKSHNWKPVPGGDQNLVQMQMVKLEDAGKLPEPKEVSRNEPTTTPINPGRVNGSGKPDPGSSRAED
jgi:HK97 family phage portal protein